MKAKLIAFLFVAFASGIYGQEFVKGTLITTHYDTIANVDIQVMNDAKSLLHLNYIDEQGTTKKIDIENVKCYTRGEDVFCRIYSAGEMILVKQVIKGSKMHLFKRSYNGTDVHYVEKVYDECIKVPAMSGKFRKVMSSFLDSAPDLAARIKSKELKDIYEIVKLYNKS